MRSILRPSLMFGPGDSSFNRFAALARMLPVVPLPGAETRFQPIYAGDVAEAIARAVDGTVPGGRVYELGGPEIRTMREMMDFVFAVTERRRAIVPLPNNLARAMGGVLGTLDRLTLGLIPDELVTTRDQAILLESHNVVSEEALADKSHAPGSGHHAHHHRGHRAELSPALPQDRPVRPQAQRSDNDDGPLKRPIDRALQEFLRDARFSRGSAIAAARPWVSFLCR